MFIGWLRLNPWYDPISSGQFGNHDSFATNYSFMPNHIRLCDQYCTEFLSLYVSDFFSGSYPISIWKKRVEIFAESRFDQNTKSFFSLFFSFNLVIIFSFNTDQGEGVLRLHPTFRYHSYWSFLLPWWKNFSLLI